MLEQMTCFIQTMPSLADSGKRDFVCAEVIFESCEVFFLNVALRCEWKYLGAFNYLKERSKLVLSLLFRDRVRPRALLAR